MIKNTLIFALLSMTISCNQANKHVEENTSNTQNVQNTNEEIKKTKQIIIDELKRLKSIFASNDKDKISNFFSFPITENKFKLYIDNENFNTEYGKNKNLITKKMFLNYFDDIHKSTWINQMNELFKHINPDKLEEKDNLNHESIIHSEPCYYFYEIYIENKVVKLILGSKSNTNFINKSSSEEETPENDSSNCESTIWWTFELIGEKLQLKEISGAG